MKKTLRFISAFVLGVTMLPLATHAASVTFSESSKNGTWETVRGYVSFSSNSDTLSIEAEGVEIFSVQPGYELKSGDGGESYRFVSLLESDWSVDINRAALTKPVKIYLTSNGERKLVATK